MSKGLYPLDRNGDIMITRTTMDDTVQALANELRDLIPKSISNDNYNLQLEGTVSINVKMFMGNDDPYQELLDVTSTLHIMRATEDTYLIRSQETPRWRGNKGFSFCAVLEDSWEATDKGYVKATLRDLHGPPCIYEEVRIAPKILSN